MISLSLPPKFRRQVHILLIGAGGNGSAMLTGLARMHMALRELGHDGFRVTVADPDRVSHSNIGRQMFSPADVGQFKSDVLIGRVNLFYGLDWQSKPEAVTRQNRVAYPGLVISCVDTAAARRGIHKAFRYGGGADAKWWLDLGNEAHTGQFILGSFGKTGNQLITTGAMQYAPTEAYPTLAYVPNILQLFPKLARKRFRESNAPSCSMAEALRKQDLFINQAVATHALALLWDWFREGRIERHGGFVNLESGTVRPLPIDPVVWQRMAAPAKQRMSGVTGAKRINRRKTRQADPNRAERDSSPKATRRAARKARATSKQKRKRK